MSESNAEVTVSRKALRLWPGVAAAILLILLRYAVPAISPDADLYGFMGGMAMALVILIWWLAFSRAPWVDRIAGVVLIPLVIYAAMFLVHVSVRTGGMGFLVPMYALPLLALVLVAWAAATRDMGQGARLSMLVAVMVVSAGAFTLLRTDGMKGSGAQWAWRWSPTPEERLLAQRGAGPAATTAPQPVAETSNETAPAPAPAAEAVPPAGAPTAPETTGIAAEWPGFRGPNRDSVVHGVRIETDWAASPPAEIWRRAVGPGWSSFAVSGGLIYTQEQRGEHEIVSAYSLKTGEPVWMHRDAVRFWESNAGPGPRATPTLAAGRVYTLGATGILNALDAATGKKLWSKNAASDTGAKVPDWGFAGSPLVTGDVVVVATAGSMAAYDAATGKLRWTGPSGGAGYSSPHLSTIGGVAQVLLLHGPGAMGVSPGDGKVLWKHAWAGDGIVQPAVIDGGDVLLGSGSGLSSHNGMVRVAVARDGGGWTVKERWTTNRLKPYFNDFVVHKGHAYGFDGTMISCISLEDGVRKWKGGRYGNGQLVLLADQDLLLVVTEDGELALVRAAPDEFTELAKRPALEGKTWNHPALARGVLLVRNGQEMAAFRVVK